MARLTGPLLSHSARGQIAHALTFQVRSGVRLCRPYKVSPDPKTASQLETRQVFSWLQTALLRQTSVPRNNFIAAAFGKPTTMRSLWTGANVAALKTSLNLLPLKVQIAVRGGPPPAAMVVTPGAGSVTVALTAPALPNGWSILRMELSYIKDQDPHGAFTDVWTWLSDATSPYSITRFGLTAGVPYYVSAGFRFNRPDGKSCWGNALTALFTPT